jgi:hypothetical protein
MAIRLRPLALLDGGGWNILFSRTFERAAERVHDSPLSSHLSAGPFKKMEGAIRQLGCSSAYLLLLVPPRSLCRQRLPGTPSAHDRSAPPPTHTRSGCERAAIIHQKMRPHVQRHHKTRNGSEMDDDGDEQPTINTRALAAEFIPAG